VSHQALIGIVAALCLSGALADAAAAADDPGLMASDRTSFLLSRSAAGGIPDAPSRHPAVSHDQRFARLMAYESDATDIVGGDTNGATDIFVVHRDAPYRDHGTPWRIGPTELVSKGMGGAPANGPSWGASLDGDSHHKPHCVAFVSGASNLVPGDTNGKPDAFVKDLRTGALRRVSVDASGRQANGSTTEVSVDGACERIAFVSDGANLALRRTRDQAWAGARTSGSAPGVAQVYVHVLGGEGQDAGFKGLTFLASASRFGRAGNGPSYGVSMARAGKDVVFASTATNLAAGDRTPAADVYERSFDREYQHLGHGKGVQALTLATRLVSAGPGGHAGNGASSHPTISDDGRYVAYETLADDLAPGDSNGVSDVLRADLSDSRNSQRWISRSAATTIGNGASNRPVISDAGKFVLFDSEASNFKQADYASDDLNNVRDVFLWNAPTGNVSLESRDSDNRLIPGASQAPATSSRGNYVPFESAYPLIDRPMAQTAYPSLVSNPVTLLDGLLPSLLPPELPALSLTSLLPQVAKAGISRRTVARAAAADQAIPALQQVYIRYLGPK
jgi:hypothetical protein